MAFVGGIISRDHAHDDPALSYDFVVWPTELKEMTCEQQKIAYD